MVRGKQHRQIRLQKGALFHECSRDTLGVRALSEYGKKSHARIFCPRVRSCPLVGLFCPCLGLADIIGKMSQGPRSNFGKFEGRDLDGSGRING